MLESNSSDRDRVWTMIDSFRAAYFTWDRTNDIVPSHSYQRSADSQLETEREFDYGEFPLEQFYNLILETNYEFETVIEQETTIGIEINKNPFLLSGEGINSLPASQAFNTNFLPSPYVREDFISKKNYLGLFIEHEIYLSDRLSLNFEGTFDVVIDDITDLPELPSVEPIENNNFYPELSINYELSDPKATHQRNRLFLYTTVEYSTEPIEGTDARDRPFDSETYEGLEIGIENQFSDRWLAILSFYHETQSNIIAIDPNEPDFDLQINQQTSNSWTGEIRGKLNSGWWLYGFYTYADTAVTEDEIITVNNSIAGVPTHSGGMWTSYEIPQGVWQGLGFGSGLLVNGDRPSDVDNSFTLPSYVQTDVAMFYSQDDFRVAVSIQNLFNAGIEDEDATERSLFSTVWLQF